MKNCQSALKKYKIKVIDHGNNIYSLEYNVKDVYNGGCDDYEKKHDRRVNFESIPTLYLNSANILILSCEPRCCDNKFKVNPDNIESFLSIVDNLNSIFNTTDINEVIK